ARTAELTVVNADLEKAMRAKDEFMAAMSHELRTPLTGILGGAGALQGSTDDTLSDKQKKSVNLIERNGHRLLSLVNDLIDYSRLQSGKQILFKSPYALTDICIAALRSVETDAKRKKQSVSLQSQPEGIIVDTDVTLMKKMLIHLLRNASKFTPEGGEFGISLTEKSEQHCVEVVVWDTGIGIKKSDIANIFTPFVQLDATLARKYEGTGLGLAIVNKLVELFDGKMDVFSIPGSGSRFVILLPWKGPTEQ
ncbi:MAG TPA: HAMP domain-containing sensor histidine kinase, partial [Anaerolineales bacterium]|nr:HAMP domain-containing sensor histidine kinase [Anaerolineales bacterium]